MNNNKKPQQKTQNQGGLVEKLVKSGALRITTGARACFNTNLLDYKQKNALAQEISAVDPTFAVSDVGNWFTLNSEQTEFGAKPKDFRNQILGAANLYRDFNPDQNFASYGVVNFDIDFTKFDINEDLVKRGYGVIFIGDSKNPSDSAFAHIANAKFVKINPAHKTGFVRTLHDTVDSVSCVFRNHGTILIYLFNGSVEKQATQFWPRLKLISIPVDIERDEETFEIVSVNLGYINVQETCYPDTITGILDNLGRRADYGFLRNLVIAFGGRPDDYLANPTAESDAADTRSSNTRDNRRNSKTGAYNNENTATDEVATEEAHNGDRQIKEIDVNEVSRNETCSIGEITGSKEE